MKPDSDDFRVPPKFFLLADEQRKRFIDRIDDPDKNWKFSVADIAERKFWDPYMKAYGECLTATSTPNARWYAIPADDKENAPRIRPYHGTGLHGQRDSAATRSPDVGWSTAQTPCRPPRIVALMLAVPLRHFFPAPTSQPSRSVPAVEADRWSTSSFAAATDTSPLELLDLGEHLKRCRRSRGPLFAALCLSDAVDRFLAPRFMTAIVAIALIGALFPML